MDTLSIEEHLGPDAALKVAALTGLVSVALYVELPELILLVGLAAYAMASSKRNLAPQWVYNLADHKVVAAISARPLPLLLAAMLAASFVGMVAQMAVALISACAYKAVYELGARDQPKPQKSFKSKNKPNASDDVQFRPWRRRAPDAGTPPASATSSRSRRADSEDSNQSPVAAAQEASVVRTGLDGEVQELVRSSTATKSDEAVARRLVRMACKSIHPVVPEAEVTAIPSGNMELIGASGAKPEIDMVVTVEPSVLAERLRAYFLKGQTRIQKSLDTLAPDVLQKTSTKVFSERLTFVRFWRSQFSGPEPVIVLLVPVELGIFSYPIRLKFAVNTPHPLRLSTLTLKESSRNKELIMLVTRWARDRCISNTSRGQPNAFAWGLLAIYFTRHALPSQEFTGKSVAELFKEFVNFYDAWFKRGETRVSVCFSNKTVEPSAENVLWGVPYIEDPFESDKDAAAFMTADGVMRVKEELARACELFGRDAQAVTLAELLERWTPPTTEA